MTAADIFIRGVLAVGLVLALIATWHSVASSEPALNFPSQHHPWLHQLYAPEPSREKCCDPGDCFLVEYHIAPNRPAGMSGYVAHFGNERLDVPSDRVVRTANPTRQAVLCIRQRDLHVYCFIATGEG